MLGDSICRWCALKRPCDRRIRATVTGGKSTWVQSVAFAPGYYSKLICFGKVRCRCRSGFIQELNWIELNSTTLSSIETYSSYGSENGHWRNPLKKMKTHLFSRYRAVMARLLGFHPGIATHSLAPCRMAILCLSWWRSTTYRPTRTWVEFGGARKTAYLSPSGLKVRLWARNLTPISTLASNAAFLSIFSLFEERSSPPPLLPWFLFDAWTNSYNTLQTL